MAERSADLIAFEQSLVAFFIEAADLLGVPKSVAAIYGVCFASPEPLGFSEIQARLDISAGSISQGLRFLREIGALKPVSELPAKARGKAIAAKASSFAKASEDKSEDRSDGSGGRLSTIHPQLSTAPASPKRELYTPDLELRKLVSHFLETRVGRQLESGRTRLKAIKGQLPADSASQKVLKARLQSLAAWHSRAELAVPLVRTFLKLT